MSHKRGNLPESWRTKDDVSGQTVANRLEDRLLKESNAETDAYMHIYTRIRSAGPERLYMNIWIRFTHTQTLTHTHAHIYKHMYIYHVDQPWERPLVEPEFLVLNWSGSQFGSQKKNRKPYMAPSVPSEIDLSSTGGQQVEMQTRIKVMDALNSFRSGVLY